MSSSTRPVRRSRPSRRRGTAGPVDVDVTAAGSPEASLPAGYTYLAAGTTTPPTVSGLDPVSGPTSGGQTVTITGSGFGPGTLVGFDGLAATDVTVAGDTTLTAVTPAHPAGPVDVVVTTTGGSSSPGRYSYVPPAAAGPSVAVISPDSGPTDGGQPVVVTGSGFAPGSTVEIGAHPATDVAVNPAGTEITAVTPAGTAGRVAVVIADPAGTTASVPDGYTYQSAPVLAGMDPAAGPATGDQRVIITGSGFDHGGTTVRFGSHVATDVVVLSDDELSVRTPPGTGSVHVVVTDADGSATSPGDYTYELGDTSSAAGGGALPFTGMNALETIGVGCWLLAAGACASLFAGGVRRRR